MGAKIPCINLWLIIFSSFFLGLPLPANSNQAKSNQDDINFSKKNINYIYNPGSPIQFASRVMLSDGDATIYVKLTLGVLDTLLKTPAVTYQISDSYTSKVGITDSLVWKDHLYKKEGNNYFLKWKVSLDKNKSNIVLFQVTYPPLRQEAFYYDIPISGERNYPPSNIITMEKNGETPIFRDYILKNESFRITSARPDLNEVFVYYYNNEFGPNPPPMADEEQVQKELNIDSTFSIPVNKPLSFSKEGLYFIQSDTNSLSGIAFRITDNYYPKYKRVSQLIGPLRYISTNDEMNALRSADEEDRKQALDQFWLDVTQSRDRAKRIIKNYYQQVTLTNKIFTSYKEGWKTGQGMIYLLYGIPDEVYRDGKEEEWIYHSKNNLNALKFSFVKVKNIFTQHHYELIRRKGYEKYWYRNIDLWRKGRKNI